MVLFCALGLACPNPGFRLNSKAFSQFHSNRKRSRLAPRRSRRLDSKSGERAKARDCFQRKRERKMADAPSERVGGQKASYAVDVQAGKTYYWCSCGSSANQSFCYGSHKGTGLATLAHTAAKDEKLWFCGCKA